MRFEYITKAKKESAKRDFTTKELELKKNVEDGVTVLCHNEDLSFTKLIQWAKKKGIYIDIDHHRSKWLLLKGFYPSKEYNKRWNQKMLLLYKERFEAWEEKKHSKVKELRGKVLGTKYDIGPGLFLKLVANKKTCLVCGHYTGEFDNNCKCICQRCKHLHKYCKCKGD